MCWFAGFEPGTNLRAWLHRIMLTHLSTDTGKDSAGRS
jgi:DNA-directed RNA polymerase specialized sigma24 family protein